MHSNLAAVTARYLVENRLGRLIEARIWRLAAGEDANKYAADVRTTALQCSTKQLPVLCADHRKANVYPPEVADALALAFLPNNERFDRIAILVSPENATLLLQLQRLTRQAGSERRKVFLEPVQALEHLRAALDDKEHERARAFLVTD
jgi:hypothetical protein